MIIAILFSVPGQGKILFTLPRVQLPEWLAGIFLGGDVTAERLRFVLLESLIIFALVVTLAGASSLANLETDAPIVARHSARSRGRFNNCHHAHTALCDERAANPRCSKNAGRYQAL